jgi:hypothetical protein
MTLPKRLGEPFTIGEARALTREDIAVLALPRESAQQVFPAKLRESHHTVARFLAVGLTQVEVAERTGYSVVRIHQLAAAPAMQELIAKYRTQIDSSFIASADEYHSLLLNNMVAAERHISDQIAELDEVGELLPISKALAIARDGADRLGYGKKRESTVNINLDFAARLEGAIARSGKVIDVSRSDSTGAASRSNPVGSLPRVEPSRSVLAPQALSPPLRRRA